MDKILNFKTLDFESVTTILAENRNIERKNVRSILQGTASPTDITTYEQYEAIFKLRHDAIHWLICEHRDLPFGEKKISEFKWNDKVYEHQYYNLIKNQTPDILIQSGNTIKVSELTVSRMKHADIPKITKYRLLIDILKSAGYDAQLEVIVINSAFSVPDMNFLMTEYDFPSSLIDSIYIVIDNVDRIIHQINETPNGIEWMAKFRGISLEQVDFGLSDEDVVDFHSGVQRKVFKSDDDLRSILLSDQSMEISEDEDKLIEQLVDNILPIKSKLLQSQSYDKPIKDLEDFHSSNKSGIMDDDIRSFMPLPYFESLNISSERRSTWEDLDKLIILKAALVESNDHFLSKLSGIESEMAPLHLSKELKYEVALQGPGRRKFIQQGSIPHIKESERWHGHWLPIRMDGHNHIQDISMRLSLIDKSESDPLKMTGPGLNYIKICQSIFREININALRKERRHNFIVKPTGIAGLYVVLYPGPKLRTGENLSKIWFKLILLKDYFTYDRHLSSSWIFKKIQEDKNCYHSKWLTTDAHRLDHYLRCYDKILMAYACYSSMGEGSLHVNMSLSLGNTLGLMIMIYMEDKRSTSKMLQDVRYLIMTCLSMFNYYSDVIEKFKDPIRTPLQSYLLSRIIDYVKNPDLKPMILSSQFGKLNVESGTGDTFDRLSGAKIHMPRILTFGPPINFKQMLCEMYFTMLFNKNQDDPTHASFQILSKVLEGEESLNEVKRTTKLHMGYDKTPAEDIDTLINNPHKNQFSRSIIMIASKLQAKSQFNKANSGIAHRIASQSTFINKYLDEFATFKSSSTFIRSHYDPSVYQSFREGKTIKVSDEIGQQNPRRRCIEGVAELLRENYMRSFDLIPRHLKEPIRFQIFKKNQIGGVREILILDIHKRVLINVLESFSRVICRDDDREMLTHGDKKMTLMRDLIRQLKRGDSKRVVMNYNFDKTRWAPSFMPIQFIYMFLPFKKLYPSLFRFIMISLINHSNKEFILPERLVRVWRNDLDNTKQHLMDDNLQKLKEQFIETKKLSYINESNMGQGILHYTSSYFHLCFISLRDEVYRRVCRRAGIDPGEWRDLVSSDDSYTAHALPADSSKKIKSRIALFMKSQEVVERVMNIWTSRAKSSISLLIYEFNSLFGSNLTMYPTTFKFALAAVHPVNTDSFFRMTKESYIASRQIVENGGSLELYLLASRLNKDYCESIYHTYEGGVNTTTHLGIRKEFAPYQAGIYPIMDPGLMIMYGPECHNYSILSKKDQMNDRELQLFQSMHTLVRVNDPEVYAAVNTLDDVFVGVNRIEAKIGPIRRLESIKESINLKWDNMQEVILRDPLLLFNDPKNKEELAVKVFMKLYRFGAAEALRTTAASLYYGRVAASVSAEAFVIPFVTTEKKTYSQCMIDLLNLKVDPLDFDLLYPNLEEFKIVEQLSKVDFVYSQRNELETQNIRMLQLNKLQQRLSNSVIDILNHFWGNPKVPHTPTSFLRDWINLQEALPMIKPTLTETIDQFSGENDEKIRTLLLVILRLMGSTFKPMKAIIYGPSSKSFDNSYLILKQQNLFTNATSTESLNMYWSQNVSRVTDKLAFAFNLFALSIISSDGKESKICDVDHLLSDKEIEGFFLDNTLSPSSYKKILLMLLYHGRVNDITGWSKKTHTIFHKWVVRSKQSANGQYFGPFSLKLQLGGVILNLSYDDGRQKYSISVNTLNDLHIIKELIDKSSEISGVPKEIICRKIDKGSFFMTDDNLVKINNDSGFNIHIQTTQGVIYRPERVVLEDNYFVLYSSEGSQIMKTIEGLLHTDYVPKKGDIKNDFFINGISFSKLSKLRPFNTHFSIESCTHNELLNLVMKGQEPSLDDLKVPKPKVSPITNIRLGTNFPIRNQEYEFTDMLIESNVEEKYKESKIDYENMDPDMLYDQFINQTDYEGILGDFDDQDSSNFHDLWLTPDSDVNLLKTMTRQVITYQPKKILERTLNIKYQIITKLVTNINMLNKGTIQTIKYLYRNPNITYSLVYTYDKQFTNTESKSPEGCEVTLDPEFARRYCITIDTSIDD